MQILNSEKPHAEIAKLSGWLEGMSAGFKIRCWFHLSDGVFEALKFGYVESIVFGIFTDETEAVPIETYTCTYDNFVLFFDSIPVRIKYSGGNVKIDMEHQGKKFFEDVPSFKAVKNAAQRLVSISFYILT